VVVGAVKHMASNPMAYNWYLIDFINAELK